jgi:sugar (pentulose or hexulose) kinase
MAAKTGLPADCVVTSGIHDSNASLLPYLIKYENDFLLATTGTWCVFLKPDATFSLTMKELARDTLYYLDAFGNPSRASKFMAGDEHDYYVKKIKEKLEENPLKVEYNHELVQRIVQQKDCFVLPTLHPGTGLFPKSKPRIHNEEKFYSDVEYAYHVLVLSLAIRSFVGLNQVIIDTCDFSVYIEGGFRNNQIYLNMLASFFPGNDTYVTNRKEATSYGAAICGKCGYMNKEPDKMLPDEIQIEKFKINAPQINFSNLMGYFEKFISLCYDSEGIPEILDDLF